MNNSGFSSIFHNPIADIARLIEDKERQLRSVDKLKYNRFFQQIQEEISKLSEVYTHLSYLTDFETFSIIQEAINAHRIMDIEILQINLPLRKVKSGYKRALLDLTERGEIIMNEKLFDAFPKPMQDFTMEAKVGLNFPIEYVLSSILYTASVAIGNTHQVRVKNGWNEGANLFMAIVGETGVAKSHAISLAIKPLLDKNQALFKKYQNRLREYEQFHKGKKGDDSEYICEPHLEQVLTDDATLEAMYRIHHHNPRGVGSYYDELRGWFHNMGKYNKGSDQEVWLKIWSRKPIIVNRVSSSPISLMCPHISVIGGIQTELLNTLFKDDRDKNGFIERILFVTSQDSKKELFSEADMPKSVLAHYSRHINNLLEIPLIKDSNGNFSPYLLELSKASRRLYIEYYNENVSQVNDKNICNRIKGFYAKIDTYTIRFALILQLLYWTCDEDSNEIISERAMEGAINLSQFFLNNAQSVIESVKRPVQITNDHRKLFAIELVNRNEMSLREIAGIIGVSHETVRKWANSG